MASLLQRKTLFAPIADTAVHGNHVRVAHFLQVIGRQSRTEAAAAVEDQFSFQVGILAFDIALNNAFAKVDRSGQVVGFEFAVFTYVDQNKLVASIKPRLDLVHICFADTRFGLVDNLQKPRWMLMSHGCRFPHSMFDFAPEHNSRGTAYGRGPGPAQPGAT
jgi:hypothetical protein